MALKNYAHCWSFRIPDPLFEALKEEASRYGESLSAIVRRVLTEHVKDEYARQGRVFPPREPAPLAGQRIMPGLEDALDRAEGMEYQEGMHEGYMAAEAVQHGA